MSGQGSEVLPSGASEEVQKIKRTSEEDGKVRGCATHAGPDNKGDSSPTVTAPLSVVKDAERYKMDHAKRGKCVIFKNENFQFKCAPEWEGSSDDVARIKKTFEKLHFVVDVHVDLKRTAILQEIKKLQEDLNEDFENDCLCIFVLTRLNRDLLLAEDGNYSAEHIWASFTAEKCRGLAGKPKLLFFQTPVVDNAEWDNDLAEDAGRAHGSSAVPYTIPTHADFMIGHSCANEYHSRYGPGKRVTYITTLCDVLDEYSESMDLLKMSTLAAYDMRTKYEMEHLAITTSTLTRKIYFSPDTKKSALQGGNLERYDMIYPEKGMCVVFNHETYKGRRVADRHGTAVDVKRIRDTFKGLGFIVQVHNNLTRAEILAELEKLGKADYKHSDCLCIFVLTHGASEDMLWAYDKKYDMSDVWRNFVADECSDLKGKPKLVFIKTCRGRSRETAVTLRDMPDSFQDFVINSYDMPTDPDFLVAQSSPYGFVSWRNPDTGTEFVQTLCDVLEKYSETSDLLAMLTIMTRRIAVQKMVPRKIKHSYEGNEQVTESGMKPRRRQEVSCTTSTLTKDLYLKKQ